LIVDSYTAQQRLLELNTKQGTINKFCLSSPVSGFLARIFASYSIDRLESGCSYLDIVGRVDPRNPTHCLLIKNRTNFGQHQGARVAICEECAISDKSPLSLVA